MQKRVLIICNIFIAVICVVLILWQTLCFVLINSNRGSYVVIDNNNLSVIENLISQNLEIGEPLPNMDGAINIEWQSLMHKDQITINYNEEDSFIFFITNRYQNPLIEYIKCNGYKAKMLYFESKDFILDLVKTIFYAFVLVFSIIILIKQKIRKNR